MSAQLIEILFLAGIAFLIISKFISILGNVDEDDPTRNLRSSFGEPVGMKDVTGTGMEDDDRVIKILRLGKRIKRLDADGKDPLEAIFDKFPSFDIDKFLHGAKGAFSMIITALGEKDSKTLEELVDKRFINQIEDIGKSYGKVKSEKIKASCVDSYSFGNSLYIKVLFEGTNITEKMKNLNEEWVFTKNITQRTPDWYLSNIERPN